MRLPIQDEVSGLSREARCDLALGDLRTMFDNPLQIADEAGTGSSVKHITSL
jgi:hypothetical protein